MIRFSDKRLLSGIKGSSCQMQLKHQRYKFHFQNHKSVYEAIMLSLYFFINALINASSVLMEDGRNEVASFAQWEPFVWEMSSAFSSLILFPIIASFTTHYPWHWQTPLRAFAQYFFAAVIFSVFHIGIMVGLREVTYLFTPLNYDFANSLPELGYELIYEMRKDMWSFVFFVILITLYRQAINQIFGNAQQITEQMPIESPPTKHLLVKKLGKEFLVRKEQIEWLQSAGNYLNLFVENDVYPMRGTLTQFIETDTTNTFCRIHRSFAVNLNNVKFIETFASGDGQVTMKSGTKLRLSRRYKTEFEQMKLAIAS